MVRLTDKEKDTIRLAAKGLVCKEIAKEQGVSYWTVKSRQTVIQSKLGAVNRINAVAIGCCIGVVSPDDLIDNYA